MLLGGVVHWNSSLVCMSVTLGWPKGCVVTQGDLRGCGYSVSLEVCQLVKGCGCSDA